MEKLKPCPFCGTPPSLEYEMVYPIDPVVGINENLVRCKDSTDGRAKAIELWNERAGE